MTSPVINLAALEPLYAPDEEPNFHRVRSEKGQPAKVVKGRRPSTISIAQNLRTFLKAWRESDYAGASDTTRELLYHWFEQDHIVETPNGEPFPFRYYFCQRESIETLIYLFEVRGTTNLSAIIAEFGGEDRETAALGVNPDDDQWARYAFKVATGAGKTKIMSLAVVWSYFHALRESDSPMTKHFVVIAPNLTVFERLKEDFGNGIIFDKDPLIPVAWRGDWNLSVVLQDQASGASTGGTLYLTNIHRLYDIGKRRKKKDEETYDWMGPAVSRQKALDTGRELRKRIGGKKRGYPVFVESEKEIKEDDLAALRELSRDLDSGKSPYQCIVSVLMLREGWDVRNVTTIVPLRPYTAKANILPEQTLGRGLRRMTPPGGAAELVTVVEHNAFVSLYQHELSQEGVPIEVVDVDKVPKSTVTIFPDRENKDLSRLDIVLPDVSPGFTRTPVLENLTVEDIQKAFSKHDPLPLGSKGKDEIKYEGRHLLTNEVVEKMKISLPLLESGIGAVSYYREELERIAGLRGCHKILAPLLETFITEILFEEKATLFDQRLVSRLADSDVREHIRAVFVPLILSRTTIKENRKPRGEEFPVSKWKPFQATHSEHNPAISDAHTLFNLVPCNRTLEVLMCRFLDHAPDVKAFCKNAGPQALRIDYLSEKGRLSFYTPDFIVRISAKEHILIETKGREDRDVPLKARAAVAWCEAASKEKEKWIYLYVTQETFEELSDNKLKALLRMCKPSLKRVIAEIIDPQLSLPFGEPELKEDAGISTFLSDVKFKQLPSRYQKAIAQAVTLFHFLKKKDDVSFAPVFTPLLGPMDEASKGMLLRELKDDVPADRVKQYEFFRPNLTDLPTGEANFHVRQAKNLERTLVDQNGLMPIGLLRWCLNYASTTRRKVGGVFEAMRNRFTDVSQTDLFSVIDAIYSFRNEYIAHQDRELSDLELAKKALIQWASGLHKIWNLR